MKIKQIKVNNFKSLVDFDLPLAKFNCIVGLNGSGKSTVLQFFDFLSQLVRGDLDGWLKKRHWKAADINSKLTRKQNIYFEILLSNNDNVEIFWGASFNRQTLSCTYEKVIWDNRAILKVDDGHYSTWRFHGQDENDGIKLSGAIKLSGPIAFDYQGSLMSQMKESQLPPKILKLKKFFEKLHALDLLSPELLRQRTRDAGNSLGLGGERLSAFLYEAGEEKRDQILNKMSECYPHLKNFHSSAMQSGWKKLTIHETFQNISVKTEARHVADGFLRMLAVFAQLTKAQNFLLLDEIENGINPELIEFLMDSLVEAPLQVLVTTHSPMVLNYLEDDIAAQGVVYLYKDEDGKTQAIRFFDIPSMREKLTVMGPGEAYEDTLLIELLNEISEFKRTKSGHGSV